MLILVLINFLLDSEIDESNLDSLQSFIFGYKKLTIIALTRWIFLRISETGL